MQFSRRVVAAAVAGAALIAVPAAAASVQSTTATIRRGLAQAQRAHWLQPQDAAASRATVGRALADVRRLPKLRGEVIATQLAEVARQSGSYTSPRARALFSMLGVNLDYLETHILPRSRIDISGEDGVVYRWFGWRGFQFHPLAAFGALNAAVAAGDADTTRVLADALVARGVPRGSTLRWEYYFSFGAGRPPWISGMAQAVAAQALGGAGTLLADPSLLDAARRAYAAVPGPLLLRLPAGPWIRLYAFDHEVVFNAQLQAILSLNDYAQATGDGGAASLASRMSRAAQALLPRFDTGYWSLYELGGHEATLHYQQYVTQLLVKLAAQTQDPVWQDTANRFYAYLKQPPQLVPVAPAGPVTLYPQPADGWLDSAAATFTLSKRAKVTLSAGGSAVTATLDGGQRTLQWKPGTLPPGTYSGQLVAVDLAGNRTVVSLPQPFVVAEDVAPQLQAQLQAPAQPLAPATLAWQGIDPGTPKLRLVLDLTDPSAVNPPQTLDLGFHSVSGTALVTLPSGTWAATLTGTNTAGLAATVDLGQISVP